MSRSIVARLERLERERAPSGRPLIVLSTRTLPEPATREAIDRWITVGLAHFAYGSDFIVLYDAGRPPMTGEEWLGDCAPVS
jgi:hypothetical protein